MKPNPTICLLVSNDIDNDPRVQRQITTALKANFKPIGFGFYLLSAGTQSIDSLEVKDGCQIIRRGMVFQEVYTPVLTILKVLAWSKICLFKIYLYLRYFWKLLRLGFLTGSYKIFEIFFGHWPLKIYKKGVKRYILQVIQRKKTSSVGENNRSLVSSRKMVQVSQIVNNGSFKKRGREIGQKIINPLVSFHQFIQVHRHYFDYYRALTKFFVDKALEIKPDIVHCNDLDTLLAGWLIKKKTGAKLVYDAHEIWTRQGLLLPKYILFFFNLVEKQIIKKVDAFISVNQSIIQEISRMHHFKFKKPALAIYNCPNFQKVKLSKPHSPRIILYQGRYCFGRGLEQLAESAKHLDKKAVIHFRALGDPATKKRLEEIRQKEHLERKIRFLPPVKMEQLVKKAALADVGIIAYIPDNINNQLCTPNKLFEYMMAGLAIACSDLPELRRIVKKYKNGVLFDPRNPKSIARALNKLVANPRKLSQMKKNSLSAAKKYNWENEEKKLIKIYEDLLK